MTFKKEAYEFVEAVPVVILVDFPMLVLPNVNTATHLQLAAEAPSGPNATRTGPKLGRYLCDAGEQNYQ